MNAQAEQFLFNAFLIFCRVGIAFGSMPALGGTRIPPMVRLLFALAISVALTPLLGANAVTQSLASSQKLLAIFFELIAGFAIGFLSFCFIHAVRFAGTFIVNAIGLAGIPGQPIDEQEPSSHIATLLSLGMTALIFATDLHLQSVEAIAESYRIFPVGSPFDTTFLAQTTAEILSRTFYLGLQFSSPFLIFSIVWNLALGLANKMTPQLSVYFTFSGILTFVSLGIMALVVPRLLYVILAAYGDFLASGFR
jgi:flagellar biosynthesis protein FliR